MDNSRPPYHERFLHWIWGELQFDLQRLETACGKHVTILDPGKLNPTDGPDFLDARLQIGPLVWHGDVEIHWSADGWNSHGHNNDTRYNRVVLHVVYDRRGSMAVEDVTRQDGTKPYSLCIRTFLPETLNRLIQQFHQEFRLPCAGSVQYISDEAFESQLARAHRQYFEAKTGTLLDQFYCPDLSPSLAWKRMFILGLFDGLGISHNREPMKALGRELFARREAVSRSADLGRLAARLAGFSGRTASGQSLNLRWNRKGCRPANRPEVRIRQAADLMGRVLEIPLDQWLTRHPDLLWNGLLRTDKRIPAIGSGRSGILYGVVYLPSLYLLGVLFHSEPLKRRTFDTWENYKTAIPSSLFKVYRNSGIPAKLYSQKLGAVYQLKHYCEARRCQDCSVLQRAISS